MYIHAWKYIACLYTRWHRGFKKGLQEAGRPRRTDVAAPVELTRALFPKQGVLGCFGFRA